MTDDIESIQRKRGDTYPEVVTLYANDGQPLDMAGVDQLVLAISDKIGVGVSGGGTLLEQVAGTAGAGDLEGKAVFPMTDLSIGAGTYYGEISYRKSGFTYSTPTFKVLIEPDLF